MLPLLYFHETHLFVHCRSLLRTSWFLAEFWFSSLRAPCFSPLSYKAMKGAFPHYRDDPFSLLLFIDWGKAFIGLYGWVYLASLNVSHSCLALKDFVILPAACPLTTHRVLGLLGCVPIAFPALHSFSSLKTSIGSLWPNSNTTTIKLSALSFPPQNPGLMQPFISH